MATFHSGTDLEPLVTAAARGDAQAFATLVDHTSGLVTSIVLAVLRDLDATHDVAQDVFLAAWQNLPKLKNSASFLPWLRQIARNRSHHVLRSRIRARPYEASDVDDAVMHSVPDGRPGVDAALIAAEDRRLINDGLDRLPDEAREVLLLFYREEQSVAQVATLLDLSEGAVKKRLSRARTALRGMVLDQLGDSLKRTAPGSAFTIAVMAALPLTMPLSASAAAAASKMTPAALSTGWWAWLLWVTAPFAGAVLGLIGGVGAAVYGARKQHALARDDRERRELRWMAATQIAGTLVFILSVQVSVLRNFVWRPPQAGPSGDGAWLPILGYVLFSAVLTGSLLWWLPRISARRLAAEALEDPVHAPARHRRDRRRVILWCVVSQVIGWTTLIIALRLAHML